ncbi:MAG TPA: GNAT family N-acetyltransferase [Chitinophaga sp.]
METRQQDFTISTCKQRLNVPAIHAFLSQTYWASHLPLYILEKAIEHSLCYGVYHQDAQIGFARVITDRATFAYLADVYILKPYRGRGLARWLVKTILAHPELQTLRGFWLATRDAHALYAPFGFEVHPQPGRVMKKTLVTDYRTLPANPVI